MRWSTVHSAHTSPTISATAASRTRAGRSSGRGARARLTEVVSAKPVAVIVVLMAVPALALTMVLTSALAVVVVVVVVDDDDDDVVVVVVAAVKDMKLPTARIPGSSAARLRRLVSSLNMGSFSTNLDMPRVGEQDRVL